MSDEINIRTLALAMNVLCIAYVILVNSLKNNGALQPDQVETGLRDTINAGTEPDRLDYQILQTVLTRLEGGKPPPLRLIPGGKNG